MVIIFKRLYVGYDIDVNIVSTDESIEEERSHAIQSPLNFFNKRTRKTSPLPVLQSDKILEDNNKKDVAVEFFEDFDDNNNNHNNNNINNNNNNSHSRNNSLTYSNSKKKAHNFFKAGLTKTNSNGSFKLAHKPRSDSLPDNQNNSLDNSIENGNIHSNNAEDIGYNHHHHHNNNNNNNKNNRRSLNLDEDLHFFGWGGDNDLIKHRFDVYNNNANNYIGFAEEFGHSSKKSLSGSNSMIHDCNNKKVLEEVSAKRSFSLDNSKKKDSDNLQTKDYKKLNNSNNHTTNANVNNSTSTSNNDYSTPNNDRNCTSNHDTKNNANLYTYLKPKENKFANILSPKAKGKSNVGTVSNNHQRMENIREKELIPHSEVTCESISYISNAAKNGVIPSSAKTRKNASAIKPPNTSTKFSGTTILRSKSDAKDGNNISTCNEKGRSTQKLKHLKMKYANSKGKSSLYNNYKMNGNLVLGHRRSNSFGAPGNDEFNDVCFQSFLSQTEEEESAIIVLRKPNLDLDLSNDKENQNKRKQFFWDIVSKCEEEHKEDDNLDLKSGVSGIKASSCALDRSHSSECKNISPLAYACLTGDSI
eukprot:Awhi_evm2s13775